MSCASRPATRLSDAFSAVRARVRVRVRVRVRARVRVGVRVRVRVRVLGLGCLAGVLVLDGAQQRGEGDQPVGAEGIAEAQAEGQAHAPEGYVPLG